MGHAFAYSGYAVRGIWSLLGHPIQDRSISLRGDALLHRFPKDYEYVVPASRAVMKTLGRLLGNAFSVKLGQAIAKAISRHISEQRL